MVSKCSKCSGVTDQKHKKRVGMVYSHMHWDREWRETFQEYRIELVERMDYLIEMLKENPDYTVFHLDGQTIIIEDYLEIRPEKEKELEALIKSGRLLIGPWYLLPDMFLPSAEALVRNIQRGMRISDKYGGYMNLMYIPDMFGQISQTPQLAVLFGLKGAIIWRGINGSPEELPAELNWEGADDTSIPTVRLQNDYGYTYIEYIKNGHGDMEQIREHILATHLPYTRAKHVLLPEGGDHALPNKILPSVLKEWNEKSTDIELRLSTLEEFFDAILNETGWEWHPIKGEQRMTGKNFDGWQALLTGTLSSRIYLKQQNYQVQSYLERVAEPIAAMSWMCGGEYPYAFLDKAWQYVLMNHPHDSICGCSLDEVHQDMEYRSAQAQQIARRITALSAVHAGGDKKTAWLRKPASVSVFNGLPFSRSGEVFMRIREIPEHQLRNSHLEDHTGRKYEIRVVESGIDCVWDYSDISFNVYDVPALGYTNLTFVQGEYSQKGPVAGDNFIENDYIRVEVNPDGTLSMLDKRNNQKFNGLNRFEDREDVGDSYNYSHSVEGYAVYSGNNVSVKLERRSCGEAVLCIEQTMMIPAEIEDDRKTRSSTLLPQRIKSLVCLTNHDDYITIETEVENIAKDHRLRVMFPSQISANTVWADSQFDVVERNIKLPDTKGWKEEACGQQPQKNFMDICSAGRGLAIFNRGLPEYEVADDKDRTIYLTLFRSVDEVSRDDLESRKEHAAAYHYVPEAQCLRKMRFQYAIHPHCEPWWKSGVARKALIYNTDFEAIPVKEAPPERYKEFLKIDGQNIVFSALYVGNDNLYLRIYNPSNCSEEAIVEVTNPGICLRGAAIVNLKHNVIHSVKTKDKGFRIQIEPKKIITLKLDVAAEE